MMHLNEDFDYYVIVDRDKVLEMIAEIEIHNMINDEQYHAQCIIDGFPGYDGMRGDDLIDVLFDFGVEEQAIEYGAIAMVC